MGEQLEVWAVNRHAHEAVPLKQDSIRYQGEPFVPKATLEAFCKSYEEEIIALRCALDFAESDAEKSKELLKIANMLRSQRFSSK